jgi:hypothetical protein
LLVGLLDGDLLGNQGEQLGLHRVELSRLAVTRPNWSVSASTPSIASNSDRTAAQTGMS